MNIRTLKLHNYRMFENLELNLDPEYTLIIGKNGSGKSTVLEAIAIAASTLFYKIDGIPKLGIKKTDARRKYFPLGSNDDVQQQYPVQISASGKVNKKDIVWSRSLNSSTGTTTIVDAREMTDISLAYQERMQQGDADLILPLAAYYGTGRLWDYHREKRDDTFQYNTRTNGYIDCLDGTANTKLMMNWFKKMTIEKYQRQERGLEEQPELAVVYHAMTDCLSMLSEYKNPKLQYNLNTNELDIYYVDDSGLDVRIPLSLMSDGYREIINVVADIAYRMAVLNPQLLNNVLTETDGIVLIDEIDLHLHPAWQQKVISMLTGIFPRIQFIFTTHAPAVISSVESRHLRILENTNVNTTNNQTYGKDVNSILSEIMGTEERPKEFVDMFDHFYSLMEQKEYGEAENVLNRISEKRDYHDQEVAQCRVKLRLERIRGGHL